MENFITERYEYYNIYVTKTTSEYLSNDNLCNRIYASALYCIGISCRAGKILTGDQIVIQRITNWGRIEVRDVRVYRKYIFFMSSLKHKHVCYTLLR